MKKFNFKTEVTNLKEHRLIFYFGEAQQTTEIEKQIAEREENKPEKVNRLKSRYIDERTTELFKCGLLKKSESVDPYEREQAGNKEKRIKDETIEPDKLEVKVLPISVVDENMRKLYKILGKDWDQVKIEEAQKEKEAKEKKDNPQPPKVVDAQPGAPEKTTIPEVKPSVQVEPPEILTRIKFSEIKKIKSSLDTSPDPNVKPAIDAVMKEIEVKTMGIEFKNGEELKKVIQNSINSLNNKYLLVLAGKDIKIKAGDYNIGFRFVKPGELSTRTVGIENVSVERIKPETKLEAPEAKDKSEEKKPAESKEVTDLKGKISTQIKAIFEEYSKMSKADLEKSGLNNGNKLSYEISVRINNVGLQFADKLSALDRTYPIDPLIPNTEINFNKNGVYVNSLKSFITSLYADRKIEDLAKKETPKAYEYLTTFSAKVSAIAKKYEDKTYVTQLGITTFEEYTKKFTDEVTTAIGAIDKKLTSKIEWKKLDGQTLNNAFSATVHFRFKENEPISLSPSIAKLRAKWDILNPPPEEKPKEEPKALLPLDEKPDPKKFNTIRPTQEAAINRGLSLSYEGPLYNDPRGIATAIKLQLQKLPIKEQYLIPSHYMTPQGIRLELLHYGEKMTVRVVGITETVARKYIEKWETMPHASAEVNEKKWAKISCVDVYGNEKPKPDGWLKTKESIKVEKDAAEAKAKESSVKPEESKEKKTDVQIPKPGFEATDGEEKKQEDSPENTDKARKLVDDEIKTILKKYADLPADQIVSQKLNNRTLLVYALMNDIKEAETRLKAKPEISNLNQTHEIESLPKITVSFNKFGMRPGGLNDWVKNMYKEKKVADVESKETPNAKKTEDAIIETINKVNEKMDREALAKQGINSFGLYYKLITEETKKALDALGSDIFANIEWDKLPDKTFKSVYTFFTEVKRNQNSKDSQYTFNYTMYQSTWEAMNQKPNPEPAPEETKK